MAVVAGFVYSECGAIQELYLENTLFQIYYNTPMYHLATFSNNLERLYKNSAYGQRSLR